ncbi:hypothetical protein UPYG_G00277490 [Umbra pygmaea]|uniref:THD domain-containing protein n=1 Tax=Umbra pygmaea TaxID=75934 RepID=A0ABD0W3I0_UMBPY
MDACALNCNIPQDAVIPMTQLESVIILLKHCEEMKRQESRLRICTFIVVVGFATVYLMQHVIHTSADDARCKPAEMSRPQVTEYPGTDLKVHYESKPYVHLTTPQSCLLDKPMEFLHWENNQGMALMKSFTYDKSNGSLIVPQAGRYFVYVGMTFRKSKEIMHVPIHMMVNKYSDSYRKYVPVMEVSDVISNGTEGNHIRTVYTGQILELKNKDHLRVWISAETYEVIDCRSEKYNYFGAFFL